MHLKSLAGVITYLISEREIYQETKTKRIHTNDFHYSITKKVSEGLAKEAGKSEWKVRNYVDKKSKTFKRWCMF